MTEREQFEAAWRAEYPLHGTTTFKRSGSNPDAYANTRVQDGWLMWQASRRAALEEAAAHFEGIAAKQGHLPITPEFAARQVRALATETNNG